MFITGNQLYRDTFNFFYRKIKFILLISIFSAFVTFYIDYSIIPDINSIYTLCFNKSEHVHSLINLVREMNQDQQKILFKYSVIRSISSLIGNTLLTFGTIMLIETICFKKQFSFFSLLQNCISILPNLFLLILLITCVVQLGFMLLVIPGILFSILFALSPIILAKENKNIICSLQKSIKISYNLVKKLLPPVTIWLFFKFLLIILNSIFNFLPEHFFMFILNVCINLITSILIIYLYRFYMLLPKVKIM